MVAVAGKRGGAISTEPQIEDAEFVDVPNESDVEINTDTSLGRYIKVWDQAMPENYCEKIVSMYANAGEFQIVRTDQGSFVSCNIDRSDDFNKISETQKSIIEATLPVYAEACQPDPSVFPEQSSIEDIQIYHFRNENDYKEMGHDIKHFAQARRYLALFWFLSEDPDFYLRFGTFGAKVESKVGRLVMFPSSWTYPYEIVNGEKQNYLIKTHLNFM
jgi:hypothetical protein